MARSFWSKRADSQVAGDYPSTSVAQSRPRSILFAVVGILIVGFLLFGIFQGARWTFGKLAGTETTVVERDNNNSSNDGVATTNPSRPTNTPVPTPAPDPVTETSSTTTTTPNRPVVPPTNTQALPSTGPASNTAIFFGVLLVSYLISRKKSLKNN
jgi:hypothetical protein